MEESKKLANEEDLDSVDDDANEWEKLQDAIARREGGMRAKQKILAERAKTNPYLQSVHDSYRRYFEEESQAETDALRQVLAHLESIRSAENVAEIDAAKSEIEKEIGELRSSAAL